jgi:cyclopropane fatty-acyl-phospholipid synthase-like methyltransferase
VRAFYEAFWADAPRDPEPWAFAARRALLLAEVQPGERVLDLGCGAGRFLAVLREAGAEPVGVELAEAAAERARANVPGADVRLL